MATKSLRPIQRVPLYQEVAQRLRGFIQAQGLRPGERLPPERELSRQLGVSRTSVRQALTALRTIGLVEARHGDGVYVRRAPEELHPSIASELLAVEESLPDVMETREALETAIARLAALRRRPHHLKELREALGAMGRAIETDEEPDSADASFHAALATAAGNQVLADLMAQLARSIALTRRASLSRPGRPAESLAGHRRIYDAVRTQDPDAAGAAMRDHLRLVGDGATGRRRRPAITR
jgi:GntR family transcriptional repressor for pyruvate dehydrogenase complex